MTVRAGRASLLFVHLLVACGESEPETHQADAGSSREEGESRSGNQDSGTGEGGPDASDGDGSRPDGGGSGPVVMPGETLLGVVDLDVGFQFACAALEGGTVACWGDVPGLANSEKVYGAVPIPGLNDISAISAGHEHACAVRKDGTVWCWGENGSGQLGNGNTTRSGSPVQVIGVEDAFDVVAVHSSSCALLDGGRARCWGNNYSGELGNGSRTHHEVLPQRVLGLVDTTAIAGYYDLCALRSDNTVACWGYDVFGSSLVVTPVDDLDGVQSIAMRGGEYCGVLLGGTVSCGDEESFGERDVALSDDAVSITTDGDGWAALTSAGEVWYWGARRAPFDSDEVTIEDPVRLPVSDVAALDLSIGTFCVLREQGDVYCFGTSFSSTDVGVDPDLAGDLGFNAEPTSVHWSLSTAQWDAAFEPPSDPTRGLLLDVEQLVDDCAHMSNGTVQCFRESLDGPSGDGGYHRFAVTGLPDRVQLAGACALDDGGAVWCWDRETFAATRVDGLAGIVTMSGDAEQGCAVNGEGAVLCWGRNQHGQSGPPPTPERVESPQVVPGVTGVTMVARGGSHACALLESGSVECWGKSDVLGVDEVPDQHGPVAAHGIEDATSLRVLGNFTCVLRDGGKVSCWGERRGPNHLIETPQEITELLGATEISISSAGLCGLMADGTVTCTEPDPPFSVEQAQGIYAATQLSGRCVVSELGTVKCWEPNPESVIAGPPAVVYAPL